jgi:hypothetical protein
LQTNTNRAPRITAPTERELAYEKVAEFISKAEFKRLRRQDQLWLASVVPDQLPGLFALGQQDKAACFSLPINQRALFQEMPADSRKAFLALKYEGRQAYVSAPPAKRSTFLASATTLSDKLDRANLSELYLFPHGSVWLPAELRVDVLEMSQLQRQAFMMMSDKERAVFRQLSKQNRRLFADMSFMDKEQFMDLSVTDRPFALGLPYDARCSYLRSDNADRVACKDLASDCRLVFLRFYPEDRPAFLGLSKKERQACCQLSECQRAMVIQFSKQDRQRFWSMTDLHRARYESMDPALQQLFLRASDEQRARIADFSVEKQQLFAQLPSTMQAKLFALPAVEYQQTRELDASQLAQCFTYPADLITSALGLSPPHHEYFARMTNPARAVFLAKSEDDRHAFISALHGASLVSQQQESPQHKFPTSQDIFLSTAKPVVADLQDPELHFLASLKNPAEIQKFQGLTASQRAVMPQMGDKERSVCLSLPLELRSAFFQLSVEEQAVVVRMDPEQTHSLLHGPMTQAHIGLAVEYEQRTFAATSELSAKQKGVFAELAVRDQILCTDLANSRVKSCLDAPHGQSMLLGQSEKNREAILSMPEAQRNFVMTLTPDLCARYLDLGPTDTRAMSMLPDKAKCKYIKMRVAERKLCLALNPKEQAAYFEMRKRDRATLELLPLNERRIVLNLGPAHRQLFAELAPIERVRCQNLTPEQVAEYLNTPSCLRSQFDSFSGAERASMFSLGASERPAFVKLSARERTVAVSLPEMQRKTYMHLGEQERAAYAAMPLKERSFYGAMSQFFANKPALPQDMAQQGSELQWDNGGMQMTLFDQSTSTVLQSGSVFGKLLDNLNGLSPAISPQTSRRVDEPLAPSRPGQQRAQTARRATHSLDRQHCTALGGVRPRAPQSPRTNSPRLMAGLAGPRSLPARPRTSYQAPRVEVDIGASTVANHPSTLFVDTTFGMSQQSATAGCLQPAIAFSPPRYSPPSRRLKPAMVPLYR